MTIHYKLSYEKLWKKVSGKNVTKILKNTRKGWNTCDIAGLTFYFLNLSVRLILK